MKYIFVGKTVTPTGKNCCWGCQNRNPDCHSVCERYAEFLKENEKRKHKLKMEQIINGPEETFTRLSYVERINKKRK